MIQRLKLYTYQYSVLIFTKWIGKVYNAFKVSTKYKVKLYKYDLDAHTTKIHSTLRYEAGAQSR